MKKAVKKVEVKKKSAKKVKPLVIPETVINITISENGVKIKSEKDINTIDILTLIIYLAKLIG